MYKEFFKMIKKNKPNNAIVIDGVVWVGKTTLMNELTKDGTKGLSIAREQAIAAGWSSVTGTDQDYQKTLFKTLYKALSSKKNYVSDRGLSCVAAYTFAGVLDSNKKITKKTADTQYMKMMKFHQENPDVLVVYVPVEFPIEADGVRDENVLNQHKIDFFIKNLLDTAQIPYITVTGTVEERVKQIEDALTNL